MRRVKQGGYSEASGQAAKIVGQADVKFRQGPAMRAALRRQLARSSGQQHLRHCSRPGDIPQVVLNVF